MNVHDIGIRIAEENEEGFRINGVDKQQVKNVYERIFKTEAGKKICRTMFK